MPSGHANNMRSVREMQSRGHYAQEVECYNRRAKRTRDYAGIGDVLTYDDGYTYLVQATAWGSISVRRNKILASEDALRWLRAPERRILIQGWKYVTGKKTKKLTRGEWVFKEEEIKLGQFKANSTVRNKRP